MAGRCPRCYAELPEDALWVCPACGYTLRTPAVSKWGLGFIVLGLLLTVAYVVGPDAIGLTSGAVPTQIEELTIAYFTWMIAGAYGLGFLLALAGAAVLRNARRGVPASA